MGLDLKGLIGGAANAYAANGIAAAAADRLQPLAGADPSSDLAPTTDVPDLGVALMTMNPGPLQRAIECSADYLPWKSGAFEKPGTGRYSFVEIAGPEGAVRTDALRFGLYFQAPKALYPSHSHAAEEFYLTLSGASWWQKDDGPFEAVSPGGLIHHLPFKRHTMRTAGDALLALWLWTGDLGYESYKFHDA